jgi:hypothetical protein
MAEFKIMPINISIPVPNIPPNIFKTNMRIGPLTLSGAIQLCEFTSLALRESPNIPDAVWNFVLDNKEQTQIFPA